MTGKLQIGQLFSDVFVFLREHGAWLLICLLAVTSAIVVIEMGLALVWAGGIGDVVIVLIRLLAMSVIGAMAYQRGLDMPDGPGILKGAWLLALGQGLVCLLFAIVSAFALMFLTLFAGILAGAAGFNPGESGLEPSELGGAVASVSGPAQVLLGFLVFLTLGAMVWLAVRLVVFGVATIGHGQLMIFRTWGWTKGHAHRIAVFMGVLLVPVAALYGAMSFLIEPALLAGHPPDSSQASIVAELTLLPVIWSAFLLGHAGAIAVCKQLSPKSIEAS